MKIRQKLALNLQFVFTYFFFLFGHSEALFCRDYSFQKHHIKDLCETQKSFTFLFSVCRYLDNDYFFSEKQRNKEGHKDFSWNHFMKFPKKSFSCKIRHHDVWLSFHRMSGRGFERCIDSIQRLAFPNFLATWSDQNENLKGLFLKLDWKSKDFTNEFWNIFWSQKVLWNWPFLLKSPKLWVYLTVSNFPHKYLVSRKSTNVVLFSQKFNEINGFSI